MFNSNPSFIGVYDNALSKVECQTLITYFENSQKKPGTQFRDGKIITDASVKKSVELEEQIFFNNTPTSDILYFNLKHYIQKYKEEYDFLLPNEKGDHFYAQQIDGNYCFSKFEGEDGGYKLWHTEHAPEAANRVLVWMFYINDAQSGTEFKYYPTINAKEGRLLIWPAGWTHAHKSQPNKGVKYIATGWTYFTVEHLRNRDDSGNFERDLAPNTLNQSVSDAVEGFLS